MAMIFSQTFSGQELFFCCFSLSWKHKINQTLGEHTFPAGGHIIKWNSSSVSVFYSKYISYSTLELASETKCKVSPSFSSQLKRGMIHTLCRNRCMHRYSRYVQQIYKTYAAGIQDMYTFNSRYTRNVKQVYKIYTLENLKWKSPIGDKITNPQFKIPNWSYYHQVVISIFSSLVACLLWYK